jgi:hypothetical protein
LPEPEEDHGDNKGAHTDMYEQPARGEEASHQC